MRATGHSPRWKEASLLILLSVGALAVLIFFGPFRAPSRDSSEVELPEKTRVVLGIAPFYGDDLLPGELAPLVEHLEKSLPLVIQPKLLESYEEGISALIESRVDVAVLPALACLIAVERNNRVGTMAIQSFGETYVTSSILLARGDDVPSGPEAIRGRRVCMPDELSTGGRLLLRSWLRSHGLTPDELIGPVVITKGHGATIRALREKRCDLAATTTAALEGVSPSGLQVFATTGTIPLPCWLSAPRFSDKESRSFAEVLWRFDAPKLLSRPHVGEVLRIARFRKTDLSTHRALRVAAKLDGIL